MNNLINGSMYLIKILQAIYGLVCKVDIPNSLEYCIPSGKYKFINKIASLL